MYVLKSATRTVAGEPKYGQADTPGRDDAARRSALPWGNAGPASGLCSSASEALQTVIYVDSRAFTRDCVGRWLQSSLIGFSVRLLPDPEQIETASAVDADIRAVIINTGSERMSSPTVAHLVARVNELLPSVPVAVLSDYEDPDNVREAFSLGVRGYIPTSMASLVAVVAVRLVCVGGTYVPATALLSRSEPARGSVGEPLIEGFTQRQGQILHCLRRGMANKLIAFELDMCESTVKVHVRNIMKKLSATNRTQVVYLTRGLFEGTGLHQQA